ncbi:glycoside hydrolase family 76 protein [Actinophytocola gossypii]|uniref:Glycosyl hydrolase n=1 Tax=Actinophytocola gossypii TaxID=2812003 RepID=A0ABT2J9H9_9PSEU|nr:glycoside hydrolase family 76 protein [Actinophytocola gossypii]MCT2584366.1 glycosyl hydrolase [Actinophytocola gossypii]
MSVQLALVAALAAGIVTVPTESTRAAPAPAPVAEPAATVCFLHCDTLDPSRAGQETFPVPEKDLNGRRLVLHVSDVDGMAWGSIDDGRPGDSVWLDRSWDGGATWEGLLGRATIPDTWTGTRTLMYNISDPRGHRRGVIRACGDAQGVGCTEWVYPEVCDTRCDGADPGLADGDTQPVPPTTLFGRTIRLHLDRDGMAWGSIESGAPGDEIWLDRSWNAGASWPGGSSLGRTAATGTSASTTMFATHDPRARHYGGAVRACGRAAPYQQGSCTPWARPATDRAAAAADALLYDYDPYDGWWRSSWWNSAATLTALIAYAAHTGDRSHDWVIARTFERNRGTFPAGERGTDPIEGDFRSRAIDDAAWWGLAWIAAYDHTGEARYLDMAGRIATYVHGYWDPSTCGGGVWWNRERTYKNAVTNGQYLRLTAALHLRTPGDTVWLTRARNAADWYLASGMINAAGLVNDGLTGDCRNNGQTVWTYNQGLAIGGLVEVWRATGDARHLDVARRLADAAITGDVLTRGGVLTESCDVGTARCDDNQKQFKGIFVRYLADLADVTGSPAYRRYLRAQADSVWTRDRDALNRVGQRWAGGDPNQVDWRTQASGLEALTFGSTG